MSIYDMGPCFCWKLPAKEGLSLVQHDLIAERRMLDDLMVQMLWIYLWIYSRPEANTDLCGFWLVKLLQVASNREVLCSW